MTVRIQLRRDSAANWTSVNPILAAGEIGYETDTGKYKIGNGAATWTSLSYSVIPLADLDTRYIAASTKAAANGVASLDADGLVPNSQISSSIARVDGQTFTGNVVLPATTVIGNISATELNYLDGVTSSVQTQLTSLDTSKAAKDSPTFTGTVILPSTTSIGDVSATEISYINGVTSAIQSQIDAKATPTDISNHNSATTSVHGIADTAELATKSYTDTAVSTHNSDTTSVHGITDTAELATKTYTDNAVSTSISNHSSDTTSVHGIADTSVLLTTAGGTLTGFLTLHADPTNSMHAATKGYVDTTAEGLAAKPAVDVATTENITATYSNGTAGVGATLTITASVLSIDGKFSWSLYDSVLFKNQTTKAQNGRYVLTKSGDSDAEWIFTRCGLCDTADEIPGAYIFVQGGTVNNGTGWVLTVANPSTFVVGTDDISVYQFSGAGTYSAGTGLTLSGTTFAADTSVLATVNNPTFTGALTMPQGGAVFSDGTQTKEGVPSRTYIYGEHNSNAFTSSITLSNLDYRDSLIEVNSSGDVVLTVPTDLTKDFPIGTSFDIVRMGTGAVTIDVETGVTLNYTPGNKLRSQYSSGTLFKRGANKWLLIGDLTA